MPRYKEQVITVLYTTSCMATRAALFMGCMHYHFDCVGSGKKCWPGCYLAIPGINSEVVVLPDHAPSLWAGSEEVLKVNTYAVRHAVQLSACTAALRTVITPNSHDMMVVMNVLWCCHRMSRSQL